MTKKTFARIAALVLSVTLLCSGCAASDVIKSTFSFDTDAYDPAVEMAADALQKTLAEENLEAEGFTYSVFSDGTAVVTGYTGTQTVLSVPETLDGHTVIALENKALYNSKLTELILPDTLQYVGNFAAMYCTELEKVTFGRDIQKIGVSAFESAGDNTKSEGKGKLKTLVWNGAPEIIAEKAFQYNHLLDEIVLPDGVREIGEWAFAKCFGAKRIVLGEGLETIGDHAFLKCRSVEEIVIPNSCKVIETSAFYQCRSAKTLTLGTGLEVLKKGAFEECASLKTVHLPDGVKTMEPYVFYNCTGLTACVMGNPEIMEKDIFSGDAQLTVVAPAGGSAEQYAAQNNIAFQPAE